MRGQVGCLALTMHCDIPWIWFRLSKILQGTLRVRKRVEKPARLQPAPGRVGRMRARETLLRSSGRFVPGGYGAHLCCEFPQKRSHLWERDEDRRSRSLDRRHQCGKLRGESTPRCCIKQLRWSVTRSTGVMLIPVF